MCARARSRTNYGSAVPPPAGVHSTGAGFEFTRRNKKADCHMLSLFPSQSSTCLITKLRDFSLYNEGNIEDVLQDEGSCD